jgi:hypothetical protein
MDGWGASSSVRPLGFDVAGLLPVLLGGVRKDKENAEVPEVREVSQMGGMGQFAEGAVPSGAKALLIPCDQRRS